MNEKYTAMAQPPADALKPIGFGKLKGKSDINPQWRYETLTEQFGLCGTGWKFEITDVTQVPVVQTGELMVYLTVNLYVKDGDAWGAAIPGVGGDFVIVKDKNGYHGNDEAYKMALTDALGNAAKMVGVAANIYRGLTETKYERRQSAPAQTKTQAKAQPKAQTQSKKSQPKPQTQGNMKALWHKLKESMDGMGIDAAMVAAVTKEKYGKENGKELTEAELTDLVKNLEAYINEPLVA